MRTTFIFKAFACISIYMLRLTLTHSCGWYSTHNWRHLFYPGRYI